MVFMAKNNTWIWVLVIISLLVGGLLTYFIFPQTIEKSVTRDVPVPYSVEKIVIQRIKVPVNLDLKETYIIPAITELQNYIDDEEIECNGDDYKASEISVRKIYDSYSVSILDKDNYEVAAEVKFDFKQSDEKRCTETYNFKVLYETDEDPEVEII
jgi:hypothetical protein